MSILLDPDDRTGKERLGRKLSVGSGIRQNSGLARRNSGEFRYPTRPPGEVCYRAGRTSFESATAPVNLAWKRYRIAPFHYIPISSDLPSFINHNGAASGQ